jgi:hypothetical protein
MKTKKILGLSLCMLFIAPLSILSLTAQAAPTLEVTKIKGLLQGNAVGVEATVTNTGDSPAANVAVILEVTGGFFVKHRVAVTTADTISPGDTVSVHLATWGFSMGKIIRSPKITITAQGTNVETIQNVVSAKILGPFFIFL